MPQSVQKRPDRGKTVTKPHQLGLSVSKPGQLAKYDRATCGILIPLARWPGFFWPVAAGFMMPKQLATP